MMLNKIIRFKIENTHQQDSEHPLGILPRCTLAILSGALLALPFLFDQLYLISWIAFVPLMLAVQGLSVKNSYLVGMLAGLSFVVVGNYWVVTFIIEVKGYSLFTSILVASLYWLYTCQAIALLMAGWTWLGKVIKSVNLFLFPILLTAIFSIFPWLFPMSLGGSQAQFLLAIQGTDLFGVLALDFIIALVNSVIFLLYCKGSVYKKRSSLIFTSAIIMSWFIYGQYTLSFWDEEISHWDTKKIGIIQSNDKPSIEIPKPKAGHGWSYPVEMKMSQRLAKAGSDLIIWPESRYKGYFASSFVRGAYRSQIKALNTPLIFHDMETATDKDNETNSHKKYTTKEFNTLLAMNKDGSQNGYYRKMKRIAFGEYLPIVENSTMAKDFFNQVSDGFSANLAAGTEHKQFSLAGMKIIPLICYEVLFSRFVTDAVTDKAEGRVLLAISNDAWFGQSRQPYLHGAISVLRAVENRLPLIHAINNGPSLVALPSGRNLARSKAFVQSALQVDMPYSEHSGGSFYSRNPWVFVSFIYCLCGFIFLLALLKAIRQGGKSE
ncbi:MAG: apolipoprotein N-acyltransferase [Bermanella sp.]